jgi:hypothetical protein
MHWFNNGAGDGRFQITLCKSAGAQRILCFQPIDDKYRAESWAVLDRLGLNICRIFVRVLPQSIGAVRALLQKLLARPARTAMPLPPLGSPVQGRNHS